MGVDNDTPVAVLQHYANVREALCSVRAAISQNESPPLSKPIMRLGPIILNFALKGYSAFSTRHFDHWLKVCRKQTEIHVIQPMCIVSPVHYLATRKS